MKTPNLFDFATSELSQDAVLAYILSWAKPEYRATHARLNQLGEKLLRALVASSAGASKTQSPLENSGITQLKVGTQRDHMDVWAEINNSVFLIIEDKTDTREHSEQIARYRDIADQYTTSTGTPWDVHAVYLKTGNDSANNLPRHGACGIFLRHDLIKVLDGIPNAGNGIIEDFRRHLYELEEDTASYRNVPYKDWSWLAKQGYYMHLESWLTELSRSRSIGDDQFKDWGYVANRAGGFLGFWWSWCQVSSRKCKMYLQIENGTRLQVRVSDAQNDQGQRIKAGPSLMYSLLGDLQRTADQPEFEGVLVKKSGRFRGGMGAAVADITFSDSDETYLATNNAGIVDIPATQNRLVDAMDFLASASSATAESHSETRE